MGTGHGSTMDQPRIPPARATPCRVSHEAPRYADRVHFDGTDEKVFEAYRELIEQVASDAYDAGTSVDDAGLVLVTSEALA